MRRREEGSSCGLDTTGGPSFCGQQGPTPQATQGPKIRMMNEVCYVTHQAEIRSGRSLESRIQEAVEEAQKPLSLQEVAEAAQTPLRSRGEVLSLLSALRLLVESEVLVHDTVRDKWDRPIVITKAIITGTSLMADGTMEAELEDVEFTPQENRPQSQPQGRKRGRR